MSLSFDDWTAERPQGRFTDWLRESAKENWTAAIDHRFCDEIAAGSLSDEAFRTYLIQDYAFIETLVTVIGFAVARAPDMAAKKRWTGFLGVLTSDENDYFMRAFEAVGVSESDYTSATMSATTLKLRDVMLDAANAGSYAEVLAVIVPAEWTYLTWASARNGSTPSQPRYAEWIELHAIPEFAEFVDWTRRELDTLGPALDAMTRASVERRFNDVMALEVAFFDQAYA